MFPDNTARMFLSRFPDRSPGKNALMFLGKLPDRYCVYNNVYGDVFLLILFSSKYVFLLSVLGPT